MKCWWRRTLHLARSPGGDSWQAAGKKGKDKNKGKGKKDVDYRRRAEHKFAVMCTGTVPATLFAVAMLIMATRR
nr:hypothetical protein GCM10020092_030050 [Actinoplanes digitatis]